MKKDGRFQGMPEPAGSRRTRWQIVSGIGAQALHLYPGLSSTDEAPLPRSQDPQPAQTKQKFDALRELMTPPEPPLPPRRPTVAFHPEDKGSEGIAATRKR